MRVKKSFFHGLLIFVLVSFAASTLLFAEKQLDYELYGSNFKHLDAVRPEYAARRDQKLFLARILEQPFKPFGSVIGSTAEWFERDHVGDKLTWFFTELHSHGIYPQLASPTEPQAGIHWFGPGARVQIDQLLNIEQPFATVNIFGGWTPNEGAGSAVEFGSNYKIEDHTATFYQESFVRYWRSSAESFYGIGQKTSLGDHTTYQPEELRVEAKVGYHVNDHLELTSSFAYQHMNVGNGNREKMGKIKEYFPASAVPGVNGANLIGLKNIWMHDNRDNETDPRKGGYQSLEFSWFHDVDGSNFNYLKWGGSAAQFIPIFSDRRIFAVRLATEKNQELGNGQVPFYNMSRLGGSDKEDGSELLRGYAFNRFFDESLLVANFEYRYSIYEYGNIGVDALALFDLGEVFEEIHNIDFEDLKLGGGGGLNLKYRRRTILSITVARGNDGWNAGSHLKASF